MKAFEKEAQKKDWTVAGQRVKQIIEKVKNPKIELSENDEKDHEGFENFLDKQDTTGREE